jgi:transposase
VQVADARKAKAVASLAAKTDKLDARVLAELARRDLVPEVWAPSFGDRELKERLGRRMHLVRLRTSAINRAHGVLTQFGIRLAFDRLRQPDALELLERRGVPKVWRQSVVEAVAVVEHLDARLAPLERELTPLARVTGASACWSRSPASASYSGSRSPSALATSGASRRRRSSSATPG